jgi:DNA-binding MarR family transcriptional regulator
MAPPKKGPVAVTADPTPDPSELRLASEQLVFSLLRLAREEAADQGLSLPQLFILQALARSGRIPVTQLAAWTGGSPSAISGLLDGLVESKLLLREHGVEDRRQVLVTLSAEGRRTIERVNSGRADRWAPIDARIRESDAKVAARVLRDIDAALGSTSRDELVLRLSGPTQGRAPALTVREGRKVAA